MEEFVGVNLKIGGEDALERGLNNVARTVEQLARHVARLHAQMGDATKREAKKGEVAHLSAEQAKRRATEQAIREGNRLLVKMARDEIKTLSDAAKEHEKLEKEKTAASKREAAERLKAETKTQREVAREAAQAARTTTRATATAAKEEAAVRRTAINSRREYGRNILGGAGGGLREGAGALASGAAMMTGALGTAGIMAGVQEEMQLRSRLTALSISTREEGKAPIDVEATRRQIQGLAGETGIKATDFAEALNQASEHGTGLAGVKAFQANLPMFSKLAMATDTKIQDLAENSAMLTSMGVTAPEEQSRVIRTMATSAKSGNIAMHELGGHVATAAGMAMAGNYAGTNTDHVLQAQALMQMSRMFGSSSTEDSATSVKNLYANVASEKGEEILKGLGVTTREKGGKRRDAVRQLMEALDKTKGDPTQVEAIVGMQGKATFTAIKDAYGKGGVGAGMGHVQSFMTKAMSEKEIGDDAQKRMGDTATKVSIQLERFKAQVGEKLLPVLDQNIGKFSSLASTVIDLVDHIAKGPIQAAAEFLAFKTVIGAASGAVSTWAGKLLQPVPLANVTGNVVNVSGGAGGAGGPGGGLGGPVKPGLGEQLGAASAGAVIGGTLGAVVADAANSSTAAIEADLDLDEAEKLAKKVKGGTATEAEKARAMQMASTAENERGRSVFGRVFSHATAGYREVADGKVTPGNLLSLLPMVAAFRGVIGGTGEEIRMGKLGATEGKEAEQVVAMMREAFSGEVGLKPGTQVEIKDMDKLIKASEGKNPANSSILERMK